MFLIGDLHKTLENFKESNLYVVWVYYFAQMVQWYRWRGDICRNSWSTSHGAIGRFSFRNAMCRIVFWNYSKFGKFGKSNLLTSFIYALKSQFFTHQHLFFCVIIYWSAIRSILTSYSLVLYSLPCCIFVWLSQPIFHVFRKIGGRFQNTGRDSKFIST